MRISFGHRTFVWGSEARGVAHVHVVIIGLTRDVDEPENKATLLLMIIPKSEPVESLHTALSALPV